MSADLAPRAVFTPLHPRPEETASVAEGYSAGYAAGWTAGSTAAAKEAAEQRERLAQEAAHQAQQAAAAAQHSLAVLAEAAAAARDRVAPVLTTAEDHLTRGAVALAETLLGVELRDADTALRTALRRALTVRDDDIVQIRLHPADLAHLEATLDTLPAELRVPDGVELLADPELARGDAVCELAEGYLDARLTTAVARVRAALELEQ